MTSEERAGDASDRALVAALGTPGAAREQAWLTLVGRHSSRMYAVARSFALDPATAEDLVQTAWLRLVERAVELRDPDAVGPWLCMVVRNEARRRVTRRREIPAALDLDVGGAPAFGTSETPHPETQLLVDEQAQLVRMAFGRLGDECRQLLRLLLAEPPLSYDEVAAAVGRPRGSLGPTRRRCLDQLRRHLPGGFAA